MKRPESQHISKILEHYLGRRLPTGPRVGGAATPRRVIDSCNSEVFIYRDDQQSGPGIVVKAFRGTSKDSHLAEREYACLRNLESHLSRFSHLHVPQPIAGVQGVLVTREVLGQSVDRMLATRFRRAPLPRGGPSGFPDATAVCNTIGQWLVAFHELDRLGEESVTRDHHAADCIHERLDAALQRVADTGLHFGKTLTGIRRYFSTTIRELEPTACTLHHPDFSPYNMILTDEGLYVLDLSEVGIGHPLEEVAFFWAYLEALKFTPWINQRRVSECQTAFLAATNADAHLQPFWKRWGMFCRLSYFTRSQERAGAITGIRVLRRRMLRRSMYRWLAAQDWYDRPGR
jgi:aminoglycoside phosphotransferase (APT) family kinase protein